MCVPSPLSRGGLVAPWTAVPTLVALTSDPARESGELAQRLLKRQADKSDFLTNKLGPGLMAMHDFQQRLAAAHHPGRQRPPGAAPSTNVYM